MNRDVYLKGELEWLVMNLNKNCFPEPWLRMDGLVSTNYAIVYTPVQTWLNSILNTGCGPRRLRGRWLRRKNRPKKFRPTFTSRTKHRPARFWASGCTKRKKELATIAGVNHLI